MARRGRQALGSGGRRRSAPACSSRPALPRPRSSTVWRTGYGPPPQTPISGPGYGLKTRSHRHLRLIPELDVHGVLRFGTAWVSLPPVEARLVDALIERFGAVVGRDTLRRSVWPGSSPGRNVLDVHVLRLRRRLAPLGLVIRTVRSRGYMLEQADLPEGLVPVRSAGLKPRG